MSVSAFCQPPVNSAWIPFTDPNDEELLEHEEVAYEEELKIIFTQEINMNVPGMENKDEEEEEEEVEDGEDMEEYGEEMQLPKEVLAETVSMYSNVQNRLEEALLDLENWLEENGEHETVKDLEDKAIAQDLISNSKEFLQSIAK